MPKNRIEPYLVLKHVYISTPQNPIFEFVMRINTRNFTVFNTDFAIDKVQDSLNLPAFVTTNNGEHQI